jgi:predicted O-methyltransferase YrrM
VTDTNVSYLAHTISVVTGIEPSTAKAYLHEIQTDDSLKQHVLARTAASTMRHSSDPTCHFGRRIGWYAFARILKPRLIVETGVERGHGALVLCSALLRNKAEGYDGWYMGTDKDPHAGFLFTKPYSDCGEILYGDSIESLKQLSDIDLLINDSDHSPEYEYREYLTVGDNLTPRAVILGDNAHFSDSLQRFSAERNRHFLFFHESPRDHWYPGAGIGISFPKAA